MRLVVVVAAILCLSVGLNVVQFLSHGTPQVVYAGGTPSGNGDVNASGKIDIADAIYLLTYLFAKGPVPEPIESPACDSCCPSCPPLGLAGTGQTLCYGYSGNVIPCNAPDYPGQDGFYQKGCPIENRFVDNQDGTVTDACTGLVWQKKTADVSGNGSVGIEDAPTWQWALQYCENLELAGHDDWRLPNVRELQSIVDYGRSYPSIDPIFKAESAWYWPSSTGVGNPVYVWAVNFAHGDVGGGLRGDFAFVRAVRG